MGVTADMVTRDVDRQLDADRRGLGALNIDKRVKLPNNISDVAFWIDYACVDQDSPQAGIEALPLYAAACPVLAAYATNDYAAR